MTKRFLILSIAIVAIVTALGTAFYIYRPNAARLVSFRSSKVYLSLLEVIDIST